MIVHEGPTVIVPILEKNLVHDEPTVIFFYSEENMIVHDGPTVIVSILEKNLVHDESTVVACSWHDEPCHRFHSTENMIVYYKPTAIASIQQKHYCSRRAISYRLHSAKVLLVTTSR